MVSGRMLMQTQDSLRVTRRIHWTYPEHLRKHDSPELLLGVRWFQEGLWQTASHSSLSQLDSHVSLQSGPSPTRGRNIRASCPVPHRAELAEPVPPGGELRAPICADPLSLVHTLNPPCSLSPLRAGREGKICKFCSCTAISSARLSQH